jgi:hypothetical protein
MPDELDRMEGNHCINDYNLYRVRQAAAVSAPVLAKRYQGGEQTRGAGAGTDDDDGRPQKGGHDRRSIRTSMTRAGE